MTGTKIILAANYFGCMKIIQGGVYENYGYSNRERIFAVVSAMNFAS
jgi:hypothetical protein